MFKFRIVPFIAFILCVQLGFGNNKDELLTKAESYILKGQLDSAQSILDTCDVNYQSEYLELLQLVCQDGLQDKNLVYRLATAAISRVNSDYRLVDEFVLQYVSEPEISSTIDLKHVDLLESQVSLLRNNGAIEKAGIRHESLLEYISKFDTTDAETKRAMATSKTHQVVLDLISGDIDNGLKLCKDMYDVGVQYSDTDLMIRGLHFECDIIQAQGKLDEYISKSKTCYSLDSGRTAKSNYYYSNLGHLVNSLGYKGGHATEVLYYLKLLYDHKYYHLNSYSLYADFLSTRDLTAENRDKVLQLFEVSSVDEFAEFTYEEAKNSVDPNELYFLVNSLGNALEMVGSFTNAIHYKNLAIRITKKTYSKQLSKSLADFQTEQIEKEKQAEIEKEKEKTKIYLYASFAVVVLLILALFGFGKSYRQAQILKRTNEEIEKQREEIEARDKEKGILLKEIHHRVKNNFQIVSSLLEMQSRSTEDQKLKDLTQEGKNRVKSMALIHQRLYQNDELTIDFKEYIESLTHEISSLYDPDSHTQVSIKANKQNLDIDTAIPVGLILNELITNAYKYGLDDMDKRLSIELTGKNDGEYMLSVCDSGKGLPQELDIEAIKSMGLKLVRRLTKQIKGEFSYVYKNGALFQLKFKDLETRQST